MERKLLDIFRRIITGKHINKITGETVHIRKFKCVQIAVIKTKRLDECNLTQTILARVVKCRPCRPKYSDDLILHHLRSFQLSPLMTPASREGLTVILRMFKSCLLWRARSHVTSLCFIIHSPLTNGFS